MKVPYVYDGWTPEQPTVGEQVFVNIISDIERDYFGIAPPWCAHPGLRLATREEWEAGFRYNQLKLFADIHGAANPPSWTGGGPTDFVHADIPLE